MSQVRASLLTVKGRSSCPQCFVSELLYLHQISDKPRSKPEDYESIFSDTSYLFFDCCYNTTGENLWHIVYQIHEFVPNFYSRKYTYDNLPTCKGPFSYCVNLFVAQSYPLATKLHVPNDSNRAAK